MPFTICVALPYTTPSMMLGQGRLFRAAKVRELEQV
jgi:hypothetical protein